jgi:hypothetical protein
MQESDQSLICYVDRHTDPQRFRLLLELSFQYGNYFSSNAESENVFEEYYLLDVTPYSLVAYRLIRESYLRS